MSQPLPLIVGFGGINAAGRTSFHHAYRRLIIDKLDNKSRQETLLDLATLTGLASYQNGQYKNQAGELCEQEILLKDIEQQLLDNSLIRKIHPSVFDVHKMTQNKAAELKCSPEPITFQLKPRQMPSNVPSNWQVKRLENDIFQIRVEDSLVAILPDTKECLVKAAGQLPTGFEPGTLYPSRNHPRNLQLTVFSASDALMASGIDFAEIHARVQPDEIGVYASNSIGQLDDLGFGGLMRYPVSGKRITSKQMPLGFAQMPADFINAYILGSVGVTGGSLGACATFLYNLSNAVNDIRSGKRKVVLVGGSDTPILPEIIEGFRVMGALADDKNLAALDGLTALTDENYRRACRPFGENCGFTIGESSQFTLLMSDDLALELGADIYAAVPEVFVNADGYKKSISAPGVGNYVTMAKSAALIEKMLGTESLQQRSYVHAHGTSTPQNRTTETHVLNETAKAFGIEDWHLAALKTYLGHSQGTAAGDQLNIALGTWKYGYIPGIQNTPSFAEDIYQSNLHLSNQHMEVGAQGMDSVILNSKGFGGNNASAPVIAPHITEQMLEKRYGKTAMTEYFGKREKVREQAEDYDENSIKGLTKPIYLYDNDVLTGDDLSISKNSIKLQGYEQEIDLNLANPYKDIC